MSIIILLDATHQTPYEYEIKWIFALCTILSLYLN